MRRLILLALGTAIGVTAAVFASAYATNPGAEPPAAGATLADAPGTSPA